MCESCSEWYNATNDLNGPPELMLAETILGSLEGT